MVSRRKARRLLESLMTDELVDLVRNGKRIVNQKKVEAFEAILNAVLEDQEKTGTFNVKYALCDKFNPLSGFISIVGNPIALSSIDKVREHIGELSYISFENYSDEETSIMLGFNNVIELVKDDTVGGKA